MKVTRLLPYVLLVVAISCGDALRPTSQGAELEAARQQWRAQNLHTYAFTLQRSCFCGIPHRLYVAVVSDTVAGVLDLDTGDPVDRRLGETVDGLFAFIQTAIERQARVIHAEYDAAKGFPSEIAYDEAAQLADDEVFYRATDVHPISPRELSPSAVHIASATTLMRPRQPSG